MIILVETNFESEQTKVCQTYKDQQMFLALEDMEIIADNYKENVLVKEEHYSPEEANAFLTEYDYSITCKSDSGDNIKWQLIKLN